MPRHFHFLPFVPAPFPPSSSPKMFFGGGMPGGFPGGFPGGMPGGAPGDLHTMTMGRRPRPHKPLAGTFALGIN